MLALPPKSMFPVPGLSSAPGFLLLKPVGACELRKEEEGLPGNLWPRSQAVHLGPAGLSCWCC